ncbi:hypothetical protein LUZ60_014569 [Juncus effusus]|nr:hypothetical protein LUZ60_014569 [Juncus effusus]
MERNSNQSFLDHPNNNHIVRARRASLVLPRRENTTNNLNNTDGPSMADASIRTDPHARSSRRFSISLWRPRQKSQQSDSNDTNLNDDILTENQDGKKKDKKKGAMWDWKPIRAISHIRMRHVSCLFSVEVIAVRGLHASMNGLRLAVVVRKEGSKSGAVQTIPSRVLNGCVDFDETLYIKCNLYFTGGFDTGKTIKFEPKLFDLSVTVVDVPELDFGRSVVDLCSLVLESIEKNIQGNRVRQWEKVFKLYGKAKGSELITKLGFQIMDNGDGLGIYGKASNYERENLARRQTKSSFSVAGPRVGRSESDMSHLRVESSRIFKEDDIIMEDFSFPEFEVIDKGVEINEEEEVQSNYTSPVRPTSSEIVKEVVHYRAHRGMQIELDTIAREIKALESIMFGKGGDHDNLTKNQIENLHAEEEIVTKEFLRMLEENNEALTPRRAKIGGEKEVLIPNMGKGLGPVIHTRDGGFLVSMNPFNLEVDREEMPKLVMQVSKPFVLEGHKISTGLEVFQRMAAIGSEELASKLLSWSNMDELTGKSAEQIAYEGIASSIITGRNKEGVNSSTTRSIQAVRTMANSMVEGRKERILTGIWNVGEKDPLHIEEMLTFSIQKMESMAIDALKIQAGFHEEEAPFAISPLAEKNEIRSIFDSISPFENWIDSHENGSQITMLVGMVLRDPSRQYEVVGSPMVTVVRATKSQHEENCSFKVTNLHIGCLQLSLREKQRLTAMQWLIAHGLVRRRSERKSQVKGKESVFWSISSRVMADMWIKTMRNPDVKLQK